MVNRRKCLEVLKILTPAFNDFFEELKDKVDIKITLIDERLSSLAADNLPGGKKDKAERDAVAAMLILQSYLEGNPNDPNEYPNYPNF